MKMYVHSAVFIALTSLSVYGVADSIQEVSQEIQSDGWFRSCSQALPRLAKFDEPEKTEADWKTFIKIRAGCLSELRRDSEAIAYLEIKFPGEDYDAEMLEYLATSHIRLGSYSEAAYFLEKALEKGASKSRFSDIHSRLALSYMQLAGKELPAAPTRNTNLVKALAYARAAIAHSVTPSPMLYTQLGQIQVLTGDLASAGQTLETARKMNASYKWEKPGLRPVMDAEIFMALSSLKRFAGDERAASEFAKKAVDVAPSESLKIALAEIDSASSGETEDPVRKRAKRSTAGSVLSQPYIPLDEEI